MKIELKPGLRLFNGSYELRERVGKGGFGDVWEAFDTALGRPVALKFFHAGERAIKSEASNLGRLSRKEHRGVHHILDVMHVITNDPGLDPFMVLEWMDGGDLRSYLKEGGFSGQDMSQIVRLGTQLSSALDCAHNSGIVHYDIKPGNILCSKDRRTFKIADFGVASETDFTSSTGLVGTAFYMSPEQASGSRDISAKTDIFSLGVLLYECCEGSTPLRTAGMRSEEDAMDALRNAYENREYSFPKLQNRLLRPSLKKVIEDCLAADPARRPTAKQVYDALRATLADSDDLIESSYQDLLKFVDNGRIYIRHKTTGITFYRPTDNSSYFFPTEPIQNLHFYLFICQSNNQHWRPLQIDPMSHDGGYLDSWFNGRPTKEMERRIVSNITMEAARQFCKWVGAELPSARELSDYFRISGQAGLADTFRSAVERQGLPFWQFWCDDAASSSGRDGMKPTLRFPDNSALTPLMEHSNRPGHFCFPFYTFLPVIPARIQDALSTCDDEEEDIEVTQEIRAMTMPPFKVK